MLSKNPKTKVAYHLQVKVCNGLKIEGVLGCCANGGVKNTSVSDIELGIGGTCQWKFCSMNPRTTIAVLFEIVTQVTLHCFALLFHVIFIYDVTVLDLPNK